MAGTPNFSHDSLMAILHAGTQTLAESVHFRAGITALIQEKNRIADPDFAANQRNEVDTSGFDVGADSSRGYQGQAESGRVLRDLLAFDEADLAAAWLTGVPAELAEIASVPLDAFAGDDLDFLDGQQRFPGFLRVEVQGENLARTVCER